MFFCHFRPPCTLLVGSSSVWLCKWILGTADVRQFLLSWPPRSRFVRRGCQVKATVQSKVDDSIETDELMSASFCSLSRPTGPSAICTRLFTEDVREQPTGRGVHVVLSCLAFLLHGGAEYLLVKSALPCRASSCSNVPGATRGKT